jgi:hypothetical protein
MIRYRTACATLVTALGVCVSVSSQESVPVIDLDGLLERAGARVVEYFARAQSIMCLEKVSLQRLNFGYSADGPGRFVESELRLSWDPSPEDPTPKEARTLRQVLRVNGHAPRKKDWDNCTTPEQQESEVQPLSILLPDARGEHSFAYAGRGVVDRREAVIVTFREKVKPTVDVSLVEDNENCISFDIDGGTHGKIWLDAETNDVLRLDRSLTGLVEIPLPRKVQRFGAAYWTMERWDSSIRFKPVRFEEPSETLILPVEATTFQVTRGAGTPRLRTTTKYTAYRRFITGGRILPQQ